MTAAFVDPAHAMGHEYGNAALLQDGAGHRPEEELAVDGLAVRAHHDQSGAEPVDLLDEDRRRCLRRLDRMRERVDLAQAQEGDGLIGRLRGVRPGGRHADDVNLRIGLLHRERCGVERAGRLEAAVVGDQDLAEVVAGPVQGTSTSGAGQSASFPVLRCSS